MLNYPRLREREAGQDEGPASQASRSSSTTTRLLCPDVLGPRTLWPLTDREGHGLARRQILEPVPLQAE